MLASTQRLVAAHFSPAENIPDEFRSWEEGLGHAGQDTIALLLKHLLSLPEVDKDNVGLVTFSFGVVGATGALARHPELRVKFLIDWEGPSGPQDLRWVPPGHRVVREHPATDEAFWRERMASEFIKNIRCRYLRVQSEEDHVQVLGKNQHAIEMLNNATRGQCPWTRCNGNLSNILYDAEHPEKEKGKWFPRKPPRADMEQIILGYVAEMTRMAPLEAKKTAMSTPAATNLLCNPGFETGDRTPEGWRTFTPFPRGVSYVWDDSRHHAGKRSARIEGTADGTGMWQQIVEVEPGRVYMLSGYVAFDGIAPPGQCCLQLVFRDANNAVIGMIFWPGHAGRREFALDFAADLKVRAPTGAARVEVNLFLHGTGRAWFDDVFFGAVPTGEIIGTVSSAGQPLAGARVRIWGEPWDKAYQATTDAEGKYRLTDIPVAYPRYILLAGKNGYRTRPVGGVEVTHGGSATVNFEMEPGLDPDDLRVKFGALTFQKFVLPNRIPYGATIPADASGYPEAVRPFLKADEFIQSDHPVVVAKAKQLVETLPVADRKDTRKVVWAVYEWVSRNIEHDGVFSVAAHGGLRQPFRDETSGIWQTISGEGWCWGRNFLDWCYRPHELLKVKGGICAEHAWLVAALLRSLNVPARAAVGSHEYWAQRSKDDGAWIHGGTTGGRTSFRERGHLGDGFEGYPPERRFSVLSRPILHEDWNAQHKGLWRELHPWGERYDGTPAGYEQAKADLAALAVTGTAPRGLPPPQRQRPPRPAAEQDREDLALQRERRGPPPGAAYLVDYSDVTINLLNMDSQRTLDVRFPMASLVDASTDVKADNAYWTNHPECVKRTWVEKITHAPAQGAERWFHVEFDLGPLLARDRGALRK
jgi:hypothetical protein